MGLKFRWVCQTDIRVWVLLQVGGIPTSVNDVQNEIREEAKERYSPKA